MRIENYLLSLLYTIHCFLNINAFVGERVRRASPVRDRYVVSIQRESITHTEDDHICSGTLVSKRDVLTTENCVNDEMANGFQVVMGSTDLTFGFKFYPKWWVRYIEWIRQKNLMTSFDINDIIMIRLTESVPHSINPAPLFHARTETLQGQLVDALGWGMLYNHKVSKYLMHARLSIINNTDCENRVEALQRRRFIISTRYLCTVSNPYALITTGDSGGPVMYENLLIAINLQSVPANVEPFHPQKVNLHLILENYRHFIYDIINNIDV